MMKRAEYQALRKICGGYHGSSHEKLAAIIHMDPLETKREDISIAWAARSLRTGDTNIRNLLDLRLPHPLETKRDDISIAWAARSLRTGDSNIRNLLDLRLGHPHPPLTPDTSPLPLTSPALCDWYNGRGHPTTRRRAHSIAEAFYKCAAISEPEERQYGNREDTTPTSLLDLTILEPTDERSKHQTYWASGLGNLLNEGYRVCYTDGTGRVGQAAAGVFSEDGRTAP